MHSSVYWTFIRLLNIHPSIENSSGNEVEPPLRLWSAIWLLLSLRNLWAAVVFTQWLRGRRCIKYQCGNNNILPARPLSLHALTSYWSSINLPWYPSRILSTPSRTLYGNPKNAFAESQYDQPIHEKIRVEYRKTLDKDERKMKAGMISERK